MDVRSIVFAGTGGIEKLIVFLHQLFPALRILPYPVPESMPESSMVDSFEEWYQSQTHYRKVNAVESHGMQ